METWKAEFKKECTECIYKMLNDEKVTYKRFFRETRSIEMLYKRFVSKLKLFNTPNSYNNIFEAYKTMLKTIYSNAIEVK
jgi:hypothetical protein